MFASTLQVKGANYRSYVQLNAYLRMSYLLQ